MWNRHVPLDVLFDGTEEDRRADVFFSQGTVYPPDVFDEWGFVGCMGTVAFRATPPLRRCFARRFERARRGPTATIRWR